LNLAIAKQKKLIETINISAEYGGKILYEKLNLVLSPNKVLGLLGKNGTGKSTLIKMLKGELASHSGKIKMADGVKVVHFDQNRASLDLKLTLRRSLSSSGDSVVYQGKTIHIASWAKKFGFNAAMLDSPLSMLSGGEQARVLIANLMIQPADVLLLDEPTNDLDIPTLEVLEDGLSEFKGSVVLVTHDRFLLQKLADSLLGLNPDWANGYQVFADFFQWQQAQKSRKTGTQSAIDNKTNQESVKQKKLTYNQKKELAEMETSISSLEKHILKCQKNIEMPEYAQDAQRLQNECQKLNELQMQLEDNYKRWEYLDSLS